MEIKNKMKAAFSAFRSRVSVKELLFIFIFSMMVSFNTFIFGQFEVMLHNQTDFGVSVAEVTGFFAWTAILILVLLASVLTFLCYRSKRIYSYAVAAVLGLTMAGYAQTLFMNKVDKMTVAGIMLRESVFEYILNILIYAALIALPIVLVKYSRKKRIGSVSKLALLMSIVIFGMQVVGLYSTASTVQYPPAGNEFYYFSVDEQLKLSKNENIVVFILDRLDVDTSNDVFQKYSEAKDIFTGFTHYTNNISEYPGTFPSVTAMLTDKPFDKTIKKQADYLRSAWEEEVLFEALNDKSYKAKALLDSNATFYDFRDVEEKFDNVKKLSPQNRKVKKASYYHAMSCFALMRQAPDCLKWLFRNSRYYNISDYCIDIRNTPDYYNRTVSPAADLLFYDKLMKTSLSAVEDDNVFSLVHLQASHSPYEYNEDLKPFKTKNPKELLGIDDNLKATRQTRGTFKILEEYFSQMKQLGIYESSTIIVLGDHGQWNTWDKNLKDATTTSLLLKPKGSMDEPLKTDATTELSNYNFDASILELIGAKDKKADKKSYFDVMADGGVQSPRIFYNVRWTNLNSCTYLCSYEVEGDANVLKNWKMVD